MYTLKSIAQRGSLLGSAAALLVAAVLPASAVFADALNPLTDRSLTLSSGSPGWAFTDGSGNSTYAPPNSGANGQKTGNTFSFKVSSDTTAPGSEIKGFSFQYCTTSAGDCMGPGNIPFVGSPGSYTRDTNNATQIAAQKSDLQIVASSPSEVSAFGSYVDSGTGNVTAIPAASSTGNNFVVYYNDGGTWTQSTGWDMAVSVNQTFNGAPGTVANGKSSGKNNYITLTNSTGQGFEAGQEVKVVFFGTNSNYITNPGADAFFVKINSYNSDTTLDDTTLVDGGVTVANVMNQSIQITTKVLETMDFSVGTVDPYTLEAIADAGGNEDEGSQLFAANGNVKHGVCDPILKGMTPSDPENVLQMGNETGEFSLETAHTYSTHSFWRLSSNSSAGATVYYSGVTLSNTVGDKIDAVGATAAAPIVGSEQFGLALDNGSSGVYGVNYGVERGGVYDYEHGADNATNGIHASVTDNAISNIDANASWHSPQLFPLVPETNYGGGTGNLNTGYGAINTSFAFDETSNTIPVPMASEESQVVDCVTGKVRYMANIAATTPAGIYTTKVNYIAAPQY